MVPSMVLMLEQDQKILYLLKGQQMPETGFCTVATDGGDAEY